MTWFKNPIDRGVDALKLGMAYRGAVETANTDFLAGKKNPTTGDKVGARIAAETLWPLSQPTRGLISMFEDSFPSQEEQDQAYHANWIATNPKSEEAQNELSLFTGEFDPTLGYPGEGPSSSASSSSSSSSSSSFPVPELRQAPAYTGGYVNDVSEGKLSHPISVIRGGKNQNPRTQPELIYVPSATTSRDGINNNYRLMSGNKQMKKKKTKKGSKSKKKQKAAKTVKLNEMFRQVQGGKKGPRKTAFGRQEFKAPLISAPTAASTLNQGNRVKFAGGKNGGMVIRTRIFVGKIVFSTTGTTIWIPSPTLANDCAGQWYLNVASTVYMGDSAVPKISQYFDEYIMGDAAMVFSSSTLPSANYKVTWCFCNAPDHWERLGVATGTTTPSKAQILAMPNSWDFNAWLPESRITCPRGGNNGKRLSTATPEGAGTAVSFGNNSAAERQSYVGTMGVRVDGTAPGANTDVGDMFLELSFELVGMSGLYNAAVALKNVRRNRDIAEEREQYERYKRFRSLELKENDRSALELKNKPKSSSHKSVSSRASAIDSDSEEYVPPVRERPSEPPSIFGAGRNL